MAFTQFKRDNSCPICASSSGKCREEGELIFCMSFPIDFDIPGWKFIKPTYQGLWGIWVEDDGRQADRRAYLEELERRQERERQRRLERYRKGMPIERRDRHYTQILGELSITDWVRGALRDKGLSDEQITLGGFREVKPSQSLSAFHPPSVPGVTDDGHHLATMQGYLCPVRDVDGRIVASQVRLRDVDEGSKYRWLSAIASPHQQNGELPLAFHRNQTSCYADYPSKIACSRYIGLSEGTGVKPFLVAQRFGMPTIGAAGGHFASSPETFQSYVFRVAELMRNELKGCILYPDAGSVINPNVLMSYKRMFDLLTQWDIPVEVAWWGQLTKGVGDADEIERLCIDLISPKQFWAIAKSAALEKMSDAGVNGNSCGSAIEILRSISVKQKKKQLAAIKSRVRRAMVSLGVGWKNPLMQAFLKGRSPRQIPIPELIQLCEAIEKFSQM